MWSLLQENIPQNMQIKNEIVELNVAEDTESAWNGILDSNSIHRFLYCIEIIENHIHNIQQPKAPPPDEESPSWLQCFCQKGGASHLFRTLLSFSVNKMDDILTRKCFYIIIKTLCKTIHAGLLHTINNFQELKSELLMKLITLFIYQLDYSKIPKPPIKKRQKRYFMKVHYQGRMEENSEEEEDEGVQQEKKELERDILFYKYGFQLIYETKSNYYFPILTLSEEYKVFLSKGLLCNKNSYVREEIERSVIYMCNVKGQEDIHRLYYINLFLNKFMPLALNNQATCSTFFNLLTKLIELTSRNSLDNTQLKSLQIMQGLLQEIKTHPVIERSKSDQDLVLEGLFKLLRSLLIKYPEYKLYLGQNLSLVAENLKCLFEFPECIYYSIYNNI